MTIVYISILKQVYGELLILYSMKKLNQMNIKVYINCYYISIRCKSQYPFEKRNGRRIFSCRSNYRSFSSCIR